MNPALILLSGTPVPRDIPLPLPLPEWLLVALLVVSFLLHILFVNLMLGGSVLTLWAEIKGMADKRYDRLAQEIARTITVNKSLAVVLGVAPLLSINVLYTVHFYSANALTGDFWVGIVPLVTAAFLLLYAHKYAWDRFAGRKKQHIALVAAAVVLLLFVPLIFLTNVNLMHFPEEWGRVSGFFSAMFLANVFPRYLHFLAASLAVTGLFLFGYMRRAGYGLGEKLPGFGRGEVLRKWYGLAFWTTVAQLLVLGPLNLLTLPWKSVTWDSAGLLLAGAGVALAAMVLLWLDLRGPDEFLGRNFGWVALALTVTVIFMGSGRQAYRAVTLAPHQAEMAARTERQKQLSQAAWQDYERQMGVSALEVTVAENLGWYARRQIVSAFQFEDAVIDLKFDLEANTVRFMFEAANLQAERIIERMQELNLTVTRSTAPEGAVAVPGRDAAAITP